MLTFTINTYFGTADKAKNEKLLAIASENSKVAKPACVCEGKLIKAKKWIR